MFKLAPATLVLVVLPVVGGVFATLFGAALPACQRDKAKDLPAKTTPAAATAGLVVEEVKIGTGAAATPGKVVSVSYTGTLIDGSKFDSSAEHGHPIQFLLGAGKVIKGWDQGIDGMKVGGKRKLTIPPQLAYGEPGMGPIPPHATLLFDVELVAVKSDSGGK